VRLTAAKGLVTSSNELTRADGSLQVANNVVVDYDNSIQQRRGYKEYSQDLGSLPKQIFTYKQQVIAHYASLLAFDNGTGTFTDFSGAYTELIQGLRIKALESNGNCYFTTNEGIKKISVKNASDLATTTIVNAGAAEAIDLSGKLIPEASGFLPAQSKVAYRLVFGYKDANSNLLLGSPSSRIILTNQSQDTKISEIFTANVLSMATLADQDYFLFDTVDTKYFVWFKKTAGVVAPVNADTLDRMGIEVDISDPAVNTELEVAALIANAISTGAVDVSVELSGTEVEVTINNAGDVSDPSQGSILNTEILITKVFDGSITTGTPNKAELNFILPEEVDTTYFYQIYRSAVQTVSAGITLNDIDPGDELQYVYEAPITAADVTAGEITIEDNTPEAFRQVGAYLYTNAITGQGIAQANDRPPIAQDMALFRNSTFYGNTKGLHQLPFSLISVDDFVSGDTKFYIGRDDKAVEYTFVGVKQVVDIHPVSYSSSIEGEYFTLSASNNERQYYFWIDKGTGVDPAVSGMIGVRIPLFLYEDSPAGSKQALLDALLSVSDFVAEDSTVLFNNVQVTNADSGYANAPTDSGTGWTQTVITAGEGEDASANEVFLSQSSSVGIAIDSTARSLVRVINKDIDSPVSATYLSGTDDLPGKILLKAKTLEDLNFYIAVSDGSLVSEFSPELPQNFGITSINSTSGEFTTSVNHNFVVGDEVYINDNPSGVPVQFSGTYTIATVPAANLFTITGAVTVNQPTITGYVFKTTAASDNNEVPNRVMYSKTNQPEAVPTSNYIDVGSKDKQVLRILALRDNLFCLKEDGIFLISGAAAPNFSVKLLDNSAILTAPDSAVVLNNLIYCLTTQGVVSISDSGVSIVSRPIEDLIKKVTTFRYNYKTASFGVSYESDRAYLIWLPTQIPETQATQCYRYSTITNTWTRWTIGANCGVVDYLGDDRMYLGGTGRTFILQERKNNEREDYADRDFTRSIGPEAVEDKKIILNSGVDIDIGDVITQTQYVSVTFFNRFLKRLTRDSGTVFDAYYENFKVGQGSNIANSLIALVEELNDDPGLSGGFTTPSGVNTLLAIREDFNTLIDELNNPTSGTMFKDYKSADDLLTYEVLIKDKAKNSNTVTVDRATWFIQGEVRVYKAIATEIEYAPQHFGKPEELKQIREGTVIFDQSTITNGIVSYATDRSQNFEDIPFDSYGPGFWASFKWITIPWGGNGDETPVRSLIPVPKQRCRYIHVKFKHSNAREQYKLLGISLEPRDISPRAYR
jgi:hypothetical protein